MCKKQGQCNNNVYEGKKEPSAPPMRFSVYSEKCIPGSVWRFRVSVCLSPWCLFPLSNVMRIVSDLSKYQ